MPHWTIEALGWVATATFVASYFFARPEALVRAQIAGGLMWIGYGVLVHANPVIAANVLVVAAAGWKIARPARSARTSARAAAPQRSEAARLARADDQR